jgi:hypothetical protein
MFENGWVDRTLTLPVFTKQNGGNIPVTTDDECFTSAHFPYPVDDDDHWETPIEAHRNIAPILTHLQGNASSDSWCIYDPYYCNGKVIRNLAKLGFPNVYNQKEDCYLVWSKGQSPDFDVLVTNPPYGDVQKLVRYLTSESFGNRPWFLLLPEWVDQTDAFVNGMAAKNMQPFYVIPDKQYVYTHPEDVGGSNRNGVFESLWYCWGGDAEKTAQLIDYYHEYYSGYGYESWRVDYGCCQLARNSSELRDLLG